MEMGRPPACNSREGVDGKLKSNLEWPDIFFAFFYYRKLLKNDGNKGDIKKQPREYV